jgi:RNA polymerase sigma-70 factor (ECF subfamily)
MSLDRATRLARICAYSAESPEWEQFVTLVIPVVTVAARRVCAAWGETEPGTAREIIQETFLKLCDEDRRVLREFEDRGDDSFFKLLRVITASVGTDHFRRTRAIKRGGWSQTVSLEPHLRSEEVADAEATEAVERPALLAQLDRLLMLRRDQVSVRDRNLFWLYYRQGLTADAISRIPAIGLSAKGVESAIGRLTRLLRETIVHGKPAPPPPAKKKQNKVSAKGFPVVVAIDSMKRQ